MSAYLMGIILKTELGGPTIKAVAVKLADHAHDDGTSIYPSVKTIARQAEVSHRSAQYAIRQLVAKGLLVLVRKGGGRDTSQYRFDMRLLMELHMSTMERWAADDKRAECTKGRTHAKSAPVHQLHGRGAPVAPKPSLNRQSKNNKLPHFTSEQEAPRKSAVGQLDEIDLKGKGRAPRIKPELAYRAMKIGLDVAELEAEAHRLYPAKPSRAFGTLCRVAIGERLPGLEVGVIAAAMAGENGALMRVIAGWKTAGAIR
jgi:hypothetical protein